MTRYCIDATEVTTADYAAFLATNPSTMTLPASCSSKTSFIPGASLDASRATYPITQVDWCDAWGYCSAVGKHLCGRIGGGSTLGGNETGDARRSEWYSACSRGGAQTYPYGGFYQFGWCTDRADNAARQVGSKARCVGGYSGIFDMSGNVAEWENQCSTGGPGGDQCGTRGGTYNDQAAGLSCGSVASHNRTSRSQSIGFRCCF
jgi:formylglycine-generating enzyme required for sulfatase activity